METCTSLNISSCLQIFNIYRFKYDKLLQTLVILVLQICLCSNYILVSIIQPLFYLLFFLGCFWSQCLSQQESNLIHSVCSSTCPLLYSHVEVSLTLCCTNLVPLQRTCQSLNFPMSTKSSFLECVGTMQYAAFHAGVHPLALPDGF